MAGLERRTGNGNRRVDPLKLHIQDDEGKTTVVPLVRDEISIGRQEGNTIRLTERNVSRKHARLVRLSGGMFLEEVDARYGTLVNGDVVDGRTSIMPGDVIGIGDYRLALHSGEAIGDDSTLDGIPMPPAPAPASSEEPTGPMGQHGDGSTALVDLDDLGELLDDEGERDVPHDEHGTLTITSTNVQRQVFTITRSPMIVGRTADNDIAIDHRSISRNHAKLLWSEGTFTVIDMGSANGVKVNGDFYKRADLHPGDELELGHVKMHFARVGDSGPAMGLADLPIAEYAPSGTGRLMAVGVVVVGLLIAAAWIFYFSKDPAESARQATEGTSSEATQPAGESAEPVRVAEAEPVQPKKAATEPKPAPVEAEPAKPKVVAASPEAARPEPTKPAVEPAKPAVEPARPVAKPVVAEPVEPDEDPRAIAAELLAGAEQSFERGEFAAARQQIGAAMKAHAKVAGAKELLGQIKAAESATLQLKRADDAAGQQKWKTVWSATEAGLEDAAAGSPIALKLGELRGQAGEELSAAAVKRGNGHNAGSRWKEATSAFKTALMYKPGNSKAKSGLRRAQRGLRATQVAVRPKKPTRPKTNGTSKPTKPAKPGKVSKLEAAKALAAEAKAAKRASNLGLAEKKYRECLKMHPGMAQCRADLAVLLMARGKHCEALKHMRRYVKARPGASKSVSFRRMIETFEPQCP